MLSLRWHGVYKSLNGRLWRLRAVLTVLPSSLWWRLFEVQTVRQAWPLGHVNFGSELMIKKYVTYCVKATKLED